MHPYVSTKYLALFLQIDISHQLIISLFSHARVDVQGNTTHYKVRLVAQGYFQRLGINLYYTYSPVMDTISFWFFLTLIVQVSLHIYFLDVFTTYLHNIWIPPFFFHLHLVFFLIFHLLLLVGTLALRYLRHYMALNRLVVLGIIICVIFWFLKVFHITLPSLHFYLFHLYWICHCSGLCCWS